MITRMFRLLLLASLLSQATHAVLILEDNFDYVVGTTLDANGWINSGFSPKLTVVAGNLAVPGMAPPLGNMCIITNAAYPQHPNYQTKFIAPPLEGYLYHSFVISVTDLSAVRDHGLGFTNFYAMGLNANNTVVGVRTNANDASRYDIGIAYDCPGAYAAWHTNDGNGFLMGPTNLIVLRLLCTNQLASTPPERSFVAWINPPATNFGGLDPDNPDLLSRRRMNQAGGGTQQINQVSLLARTGANIFFDELRVGTTWADVTPRADDFVPQPVNHAPTLDEFTTLTPTLAASPYLGTGLNTHSASVFFVRSLLSTAQWTFTAGPVTNFTIPAGRLVQSTYYAWQVQYLGTLGASHFSDPTMFNTEHTASPIEVAYDGAVYPPTNSLFGLNGGTGWAAAWQPLTLFGTTSSIGVVEQGLTYSDLIVGGGAFFMQGETNQTRAARVPALRDGMAHLLQTNLLFGRAGSTNWFSCLAACEDDYTNGGWYLELHEGSLRRVFIGKSISFPRWYLSAPGQVKDASGYTPATRLLAARLVCSAGDATNGTFHLWIDPATGPTPPDDSSAVIFLDVVRPFAFNRLALHAEAARASTNDPYMSIPRASIDEVRFGDDWTTVIIVPEPAALVFSCLLCCTACARRRR